MFLWHLIRTGLLLYRFSIQVAEFQKSKVRVCNCTGYIGMLCKRRKRTMTAELENLLVC